MHYQDQLSIYAGVLNNRKKRGLISKDKTIAFEQKLYEWFNHYQEKEQEGELAL